MFFLFKGSSIDGILIIIVTTAFISVVLNVYLRKVDLPPIVGYIFAGVIVSQIFHFKFQNQTVVNDIAEFGIVFLMLV